MLKNKMWTAALAGLLAAPLALPLRASAADDKDLAVLREQMRQIKSDYEIRMAALEQRLLAAEKKSADVNVQVPVQAAATAPAEPAPAVLSPVLPAVAASSNGFNPAVALILNGTLANLSPDPSTYRLQGFIPNGGDVGPGKRSFSLGESELTFSANVDPHFSGQLTFSLTGENTASVEEAFFQTQGLSNGMNFRGGRFLSAVGYLNSQHAHAWDFVDAPLAYQAFFGGQYKPDGVQFKWLAPTDLFVEVGAEADNGSSFPGSERHKNGFGATSVFAHIGDDIGESMSWRAGLSTMRSHPENRSYQDSNRSGSDVINAFSGKSNTWIADAIFKWSPNGNPTATNLKLQGEYFRRNETGSLRYDTQAQDIGDRFSSVQSGWYLQGIYQFMPQWRAGWRVDKLSSGSPAIGLLSSHVLAAADFPALASYGPSRNTWMLDYSASEFSRFRLQFARDKSSSNVTGNQIFLQYIMSLGAHGAHSF